MRPSELGEWFALYTLSPWDQARADLRMAILASTIANVNRDSKRRPKPYTARDFMPFDARDERARNRDLSRRLLEALGVKPKPKDKP